MAKKQEKVVNELECECGHVAGAPVTLRIHQNTHQQPPEDVAEEVSEPEKKPVKKVAAKKK